MMLRSVFLVTIVINALFVSSRAYGFLNDKSVSKTMLRAFAPSNDNANFVDMIANQLELYLELSSASSVSLSTLPFSYFPRLNLVRNNRNFQEISDLNVTAVECHRVCPIQINNVIVGKVLLAYSSQQNRLSDSRFVDYFMNTLETSMKFEINSKILQRTQVLL